MCDHLGPPKTFYINFIVFSNSTGAIYNRMTLSFILNSWIFIAITTIAIYFNGKVKHTFKNIPSYPSEPLYKSSQIGSVSYSFSTWATSQ